MSKQKTIWTLCLVLILGNVFFGTKYFTLHRELRETKAALLTENCGRPKRLSKRRLLTKKY